MKSVHPVCSGHYYDGAPLPSQNSRQAEDIAKAETLGITVRRFGGQPYFMCPVCCDAEFYTLPDAVRHCRDEFNVKDPFTEEQVSSIIPARYYSHTTAAKALGRSANFIYRAVKSGRIKATNRIYNSIPGSALIEYARKHMEAK